MNFCTFCHKRINSKISAHLFSKQHSDIVNVNEIRLLPKQSQERLVRLECLANEGNFKHNVEVLRERNGSLVVARREKFAGDNDDHGHDPNDFIPCEFCLKFFIAKYLWHHVRVCKVRKFYKIADPTGKKDDFVYDTNADEEEEMDEDHDLPRSYRRRGRAILASAVHNEETNNLKILLEHSSHDEITAVAFGDAIIKQYLTLQSEQLGFEEDRKRKDVYRINQKGRMLARLVLEARKMIPDCGLSTLLRPENFDTVVSATKALVRYEQGENLSFGPHIGYYISDALGCKEGTALRTNDYACREEARNFKRLFETEWNARVNAVSRKRKAHLDMSKKNDIPLTEDLVKFKVYLCQRLKGLCIRLEQENNPQDWLELSKVTLCRLLVFNKRSF